MVFLLPPKQQMDFLDNFSGNFASLSWFNRLKNETWFAALIFTTLLVFYCFYKIVACCADNIIYKPDKVWWPEKQQNLMQNSMFIQSVFWGECWLSGDYNKLVMK